MNLKGIDTIEFGIDVENYLIQFSNYLNIFNEMKEYSLVYGTEKTIEIGGVTLTVHRTGMKFYAYRLSNQHFTIAFMDKEMKSNSPIYVHLYAEYLWSYEINEGIKNFLDWFNNFSDCSFTTRLSRIDPCFDSDEISFKQSDVKGVVTRSRLKQDHFVKSEFKVGRTFSGFTFGGGGPLLSRIYNKSLEIKTKGKLWFRDIWLENNKKPENEVWRVEFQIRRKVLKEFSVYSIQDFLDKEAEIWAYLTQIWFTIRKPSPDSNGSRWKLLQKWKKVQLAGKNVLPSPAIREVIKQATNEQLLNQAKGLMVTIAALNDHKTIEETANVLKSWLEVNLLKKNTTFDYETNIRKKKYLIVTHSEDSNDLKT